MTKQEIIIKLEELVKHEPISEVMEKVEKLEEDFHHASEDEGHSALEERGLTRKKSAAKLSESDADKQATETIDHAKDERIAESPEANAASESEEPKPSKPTGPSQEDIRFKELVNIYYDKKAKFEEEQKGQEKENLSKKKAIIAELRTLPKGGDNIGLSYQKFNSLKDKWRNTGHVPKKDYKELQSEYSYEIERFYYKIQIHKDLKELDLKKNLLLKKELLEQMQELRKETHIKKIEDQVRAIQDEWDELGPVPQEEWEPLRDEFRSATGEVYHKINEHYKHLKEKQQESLTKKTKLIHKAETLADLDIRNHNKYKERTAEIISLQKEWKKSGRAPKGKNEQLWKQFRQACDRFFDKKQEYYDQIKKERLENKQRKELLLFQAEELKDSTEWKETADQLKKIQREWTATGTTFRKDEQRLWKSFRNACDHFFNARSTFFDTLDERQEENLKEKEALIEEIKNFKPGENKQENLTQLKEFSSRWNKLGHVPKKELNRINNDYRKVLDAQYNSLKLKKEEKSKLQFKNKLERIVQTNNSGKLLQKERRNINDEINTLEFTIKQYEHNLHFFANSKNASPLLKEVENKIKRSKDKLKDLKGKLKILNKVD